MRGGMDTEPTARAVILDDGELEIELIVPSAWLTWLSSGSGFSLRVDETGREYDAEIARIGAAADPVSQTVRLEARFRKHPTDVLAGMSGTARFEAAGPARAAS